MGVGQALKGGVREKVELASKFGVIYADVKPDVRGDPTYVKAACEVMRTAGKRHREENHVSDAVRFMQTRKVMQCVLCERNG